MREAGTVVTVPFPGVTGVKLRPAVVLSSVVYHARRPDAILGLLTTQIDSANGPTDYILTDWAAAGVHRPTAYRAFLVTVPQSSITAALGRLSDADWQAIRACTATAFTTL